MQCLFWASCVLSRSQVAIWPFQHGEEGVRDWKHSIAGSIMFCCFDIDVALSLLKETERPRNHEAQNKRGRRQHGQSLYSGIKFDQMWFLLLQLYIHCRFLECSSIWSKTRLLFVCLLFYKILRRSIIFWLWIWALESGRRKWKVVVCNFLVIRA